MHRILIISLAFDLVVFNFFFPPAFKAVRASLKQGQMGICVVKPQKPDEDDSHVDFAGGNVVLIKTMDSWEQKIAEAQRDGKIVIANFSAEWCGPCRMISPYFIELSENHPSAMFLTVDVDELIDFSTSWDIKATPTFFFLKDGQQLDKLVGANKPELHKKLIAVLEKQTPSQS